MKTTIEVTDSPSKSTKEVPQRNQPTPQALVDKGLLSVIGDSQVKGESAFKLQQASVGGKAVLKPAAADWQQFEEQHVCDRVLAQKSKTSKAVNPLI